MWCRSNITLTNDFHAAVARRYRQTGLCHSVHQTDKIESQRVTSKLNRTVSIAESNFNAAESSHFTAIEPRQRYAQKTILLDRVKMNRMRCVQHALGREQRWTWLIDQRKQIRDQTAMSNEAAVYWRARLLRTLVGCIQNRKDDVDMVGFGKRWLSPNDLNTNMTSVGDRLRTWKTRLERISDRTRKETEQGNSPRLNSVELRYVMKLVS